MDVNLTACKGPLSRAAGRIKPALLFLCCFTGVWANATPPPPGVAPLLSPTGGFSIDGDLVANAPGSNVGDWLLSTNAGAGGAVLDASGTPLDPTTTFHFRDLYNSGSDNTFVGGLKWTDNPNVWQSTTSKASGKTDINNVLLHVAKDSEQHSWVIVAADRSSTSGDSYIDFEFLQSSLVLSNGGHFVSTGPDGGRTANDLLLSLAFTGGGSVADFFAWRWQPNGSGGFTYVDVTASLPLGRVFVAANRTAIMVPYGAFGQTSYAANAFAEAAVDLTALLGNFDPCVSIGFKSIMVKTKTSQSSTATIADYLDPIQYSLRVGPSADAGLDQTRCLEGPTTSFPLNGSVSPGLQPISSTTWTVVNGTATIDSPSSLVTTAFVASASATLRLTAIQANGCNETNDVVLRVVPPPACSIIGPPLVCPKSSTQFLAPSGMSAYFWSILGNAVISGSTNSRAVTVVAGDLCGQSFTLLLNEASNVCSSACSTDVLVNDTTPPTLALPASLVLECPADTRTNTTGVAIAQDDCGQVTVNYSDSVSNMCGGAKTIFRTWSAIDLCGNGTNAVQTIMVRDTGKPVITCPSNRLLECPADTSTNANGVATATDTCSAVIITYTDSVSNSCAGTETIARTWTATDDCGNRSSCLQTITVRDTSKPTLSCPPDLVLECPADTGTNATGVATAQDSCSQVTVRYVDAVSNSCSGNRVILRTWTAVDGCSNSISCVQKITVRDITPPLLTCPPNLTLQCPADTGTNNTGVASAVDGCSTATISFSDSVSNLCGSTRLITRTWTASDACSNKSACIQLIQVIDTTPPVITCASNKTIQIGTGWTFDVPSAVDTCGTNSIAIVRTTTNATCGNAFSATRTWRATDACGNQAECSQTVTVIDTIAPVLVCPPNVTLECPAVTTTNATGVATASDVGGSVAVTFSDSSVTLCGNARTISRTWRATDLCGNFSTCVQTVTVRDTVRPIITRPPDLVLECGASTAPGATGSATAQDACSGVTVSYSDSVSNNCGGSRVISRTWSAIDQCGNTVSSVQTLTVRDTTPPSLKLPANLVLQCPGDTRTNVTGVPTVLDGCGSVTVSYSDVVSNGCGLTRTVQRLWTAADACGNSTNGLQTITVIDTTKPSISCPRISVQCVGDVPAAYTGLAAFLSAGGTATDSCSPGMTFSQTSDSGLVGSCPGTVTRVYRVTDVCGNFAECTQTITVDDTTPPVITCPANITVECGGSIDPADIGSATAKDNCSTNVTITHSDAPVQSQYDLKFYVADPDSGTGPYSPTYLKFAPGSLPCPDSARLTGRALDPLRNAVAYSPGGQLDALTSIGNVPMAFGQIVPFEAVIQVGGGPGPERGTIEFTAAWSTYTTSNNRFGYDTNYMVYCAFVDAADPGSIDPNNNARVESYRSAVVNPGTIAEAIQGTFRISGLDSGDRVAVEIWVVLMPTMPDHTGGTVAATLVSAETASVPPVPITIGTQTDSLGNLSKIFQLPAPQEQPPLGPLPPQPPVLPGTTVSVIDRTWVATDDCGNHSACLQQITIRDTTPSVLSAPANRVLECPADTTTNNTGVATVQDGCGSSVVTYSDIVSNSCGAARTIWRTWKATDQSGLTNSAVQIITVRDTTPPTFTCQPNRTVSAASSWTFDNPFSSDTCSTATVQVINTVTNRIDTSTVAVTRTWMAADACGNTNQCQQTITVLLGSPPAITSSPLSQTVICDGIMSLSVTAASPTPCAYQWRVGGLDIPGATGNILTKTNVSFSNAGLYCAVVANAAGAVTSAVAVVNVGAELYIQRMGPALRLTWPSPFVLQSALNANGPYADEPGATSPFSYNPVSAPKKLFRLRSPSYSFTPAYLPEGQFSFTCSTAVPGYNFVFQASTDLSHWINLETNTPPVVFLDTNALQYPNRFYRAVMAH